MVRDTGGSRTHLNRTTASRRCPQPVAVPSGSSVTPNQCPCQESNLIFDLRRVACKSVTLQGRMFSNSALSRNRTSSDSFEDCRAIRYAYKALFLFNLQAEFKMSRPGIEPESGPSEGPMRSITPSRPLSISTWSRTRTKALGGPRAIRYTIETHVKSRRLDSHQHCAVYKTAAFLNRATSAFFSTSARSRTSCDGFGDRLLSQEHTRVPAPSDSYRDAKLDPSDAILLLNLY